MTDSKVEIRITKEKSNMRTNHGGFSLGYALMILAIVLFFLASVGYVWTPQPWPWNGRLIAAGLCCWALSEVIS